MAADYVEDQTLDIKKMNNKEMKEDFRFFDLSKDIGEQMEEYENILSEEIIKDLISNPSKILKLEDEYQKIVEG